MSYIMNDNNYTSESHYKIYKKYILEWKMNKTKLLWDDRGEGLTYINGREKIDGSLQS